MIFLSIKWSLHRLLSELKDMSGGQSLILVFDTAPKTSFVTQPIF